MSEAASSDSGTGSFLLYFIFLNKMDTHKVTRKSKSGPFTQISRLEKRKQYYNPKDTGACRSGISASAKKHVSVF